MGVTTPTERFWEKVDRSAGLFGCWLWRGAAVGRPAEEYGQVRWQGQREYAHRVAWMLSNGAIPAGLVLDHLCRTHLCVNPAHLEVVTQRNQHPSRVWRGCEAASCRSRPERRMIRPASVLPKTLRRAGKRPLRLVIVGTGIGFRHPGQPRRWR